MAAMPVLTLTLLLGRRVCDEPSRLAAVLRRCDRGSLSLAHGTRADRDSAQRAELLASLD